MLSHIKRGKIDATSDIDLASAFITYPTWDLLALQGYLSTLANSTLIILFSKTLKKFQKLFLPIQKLFLKEYSEHLEIFPFFEMDFSKSINYSTDMCSNGQGTMGIVFRFIIEYIVDSGILAPRL